MSKNKDNLAKIRKYTLALAALTATSALSGLSVQEAHAMNMPETPPSVVQLQEKIAFPDIVQDWQKAPVSWAVDNSVVDGYPDGTFKPNNQMTEAEWGTMLAKYVSNIPNEDIKNNSIEGKHWSQHIYNELDDYKLPFKGYKDDSVKNKPVTRGTIAQIIAAKNGFNLTLEQAVEYMYENDLSNGKGTVKDFDNFGAQDYMTRAEATAFLQRLSNKKITTFRGVESNVNPNEIGGIVDPVYDGTKEEGEDRVHGIGKDLAGKYGYDVDTSLEGHFSVKKDDERILVYSTPSGKSRFYSTMEYKELTLEAIQKIKGFSDSEIDEISKAVDKAQTGGRLKINVREDTLQIDRGMVKGEIEVFFVH